jgi:hypothetical protein
VTSTQIPADVVPIPVASLPRFSVSDPLSLVLIRAGKTEEYRVILTRDAAPESFVDGVALIRALFGEKAKAIAAWQPKAGTIDTWLAVALRQPISDVVTALAGEAKVERPVSSPLFLQSESATWLVNKTAAIQAHTTRIKYRCKRKHDNPDPDYGTCYSCPAAIEEVIEE